MTAALDTINVQIMVVLGRTKMPIYQMLRMGRGSVIALEACKNDEVEILANDHPIARGHVVVSGTTISVEVTELLRQPEQVQTMSESTVTHSPLKETV